MSKLHDLNKKYSPSKSQTEPEKSNNSHMKRDFLYDSPKSQLYEGRTFKNGLNFLVKSTT